MKTSHKPIPSSLSAISNLVSRRELTAGEFPVFLSLSALARTRSASQVVLNYQLTHRFARTVVEFVFLRIKTNFGSVRKEVRVHNCVEAELQLIDVAAFAIEPERLPHISLGQENPQTWMNAAPGHLCSLSNPADVTESRSKLNLERISSVDPGIAASGSLTR